MFIVFSNEKDEFFSLVSYTLVSIKSGLNSLDCVFYVNPPIDVALILDIFEWHEMRQLCYFRIVLSPKKYLKYGRTMFGQVTYHLDEYVLSDRYPILSVSTINKFDIKITKYYVFKLCIINKLDILEFLYNKKLLSVDQPSDCNNYPLDIASCHGHINVLKWLKNTCLPLKYGDNALILASGNGHVAVLEWWKNSGLELKYSEQALNRASMEGHINVLEWWKNSGLELKYENALNAASHNGHINVLEWWKNSGLELKYDEDALKWASYDGKVAVLEWWKNSGLELKYSKNILYDLYTKKQKNVLKWWKKSKLPLEYPSWTIYLYMKFFV
uniref:Ankyrin repeat protein n=1 Tax=viral metagenome TaxID=1070528 RepID=A0A6C0E7M7_9ZZZZ